MSLQMDKSVLNNFINNPFFTQNSLNWLQSLLKVYDFTLDYVYSPLESLRKIKYLKSNHDLRIFQMTIQRMKGRLDLVNEIKSNKKFPHFKIEKT